MVFKNGVINIQVLAGFIIVHARKNEVEEMYTYQKKTSRLTTWLGCLGCQQAAGYPKTEFSFYAVKILPTYLVT